MMDKIFDNGTESLWLYRNDDDPHDCMFYVATSRYEKPSMSLSYNGYTMIPVFKCSDSWISYFFGIMTTNRKAVQLNEMDTATVIETIIDDDYYAYKPNGVILGEFSREFMGYSFKITFTPEYYFWRNGGDNKFYDIKIGKIEFSFTLSPLDYIYALIIITVPDAEVRETLFNQLEMSSSSGSTEA